MEGRVLGGHAEVEPYFAVHDAVRDGGLGFQFAFAVDPIDDGDLCVLESHFPPFEEPPAWGLEMVEA